VIYGIKVVARYLLGIDVAGRNFMVCPDDTFLVSYPRSGNTWTRFLIGSLLHPNLQVTFNNIDSLIPDAGAVSSRALKRTPRPRLIKSHEYFDPRYPKVIYLVRDPRDVALSLHNFMRKGRFITDSYPLERWVSEWFLPGNLHNVSWGEHVATWLATRMNHPGFLLIRYEDLRQDPASELRRIATFLGAPANPQDLAQAIEKSAANRMRELEKAEHEQWRTTKGRRTDIPFVGEAVTGGWRQKLPQASVALIESRWGHLMTTLGYGISPAPRATTGVILSGVMGSK
jgi:hypothetical protein